MQISKKVVFNNNLRLVVIGLILILGILFYWFYKSYLTNPEMVFYGMISNNLNTRNYVIVNNQEELGGNLIQETLVNSGAKNVVSSIETTNIISSKALIQTLSVGTPNTDYSTYQKIDVGKTSSVYKPIIGVWGVNSPNGSNGQGGQLYKSTILSPFLFSSPSIRQTSTLMNFIRANKVYTIQSSRFTTVDGRQAINYQISINTKQYTKLLGLYLSIIGYKNQKQAIEYNGTQTVELDVSVDIFSRQLIALSYVGSSSVEVYESYGINSSVKLPPKAIPLQVLKDQIVSLSK